jgi:hypothetical protein
MQRIHAFEFTDLESVPGFIRESIVEVLGDALRRAGLYESAADTFLAFVEQSGADTLLDLGSGSGDPAAALIDACQARGSSAPRMVLTDLFPDRDALARIAEQYPDHIEYNGSGVDATAIPDHLDYDACSIICAFHHFPRDLAQQIITEQVRHNRAIFILEGLPREPLRVLPMLATLAPSYFANPGRARKDRLRKFVATYPIPAVAVLGIWDAVISALRSYDENDFRAMAEEAGGDYSWTYHEFPFVLGGKGVAFYGIPNQNRTQGNRQGQGG